MTTRELRHLYERHIKSLTPADQQELIALIQVEIAAAERPRTAPYRLADLEGIGADLADGVDAQEYVRQLRNERP